MLRCIEFPALQFSDLCLGLGFCSGHGTQCSGMIHIHHGSRWSFGECTSAVSDMPRSLTTYLVSLTRALLFTRDGPATKPPALQSHHLAEYVVLNRANSSRLIYCLARCVSFHSLFGCFISPLGPIFHNSCENPLLEYEV